MCERLCVALLRWQFLSQKMASKKTEVLQTCQVHLEKALMHSVSDKTEICERKQTRTRKRVAYLCRMCVYTDTVSPRFGSIVYTHIRAARRSLPKSLLSDCKGTFVFAARHDALQAILLVFFSQSSFGLLFGSFQLPFAVNCTLFAHGLATRGCSPLSLKTNCHSSRHPTLGTRTVKHL